MLTATALLILSCCGCEQRTESPTTPSNAAPQRALELVVVDDVALGKAALREWTARSERKLSVVDVTCDELLAAMQVEDSPLAHADALVFAPELLGELISQGWLQPIPGFAKQESFADGDYLARDVLPLPRETVGEWGTETYALPLSAQVFVLGYRADILEELAIEPPRTWQQLIGFLDAFEAYDARPKDWPTQALAIPLQGNWPARLYLSIVASMCHDRGRYSTLFELRTMKPSVTSPGFERALDTLARLSSDSIASEEKLAPGQAFGKLLRGGCAMAIGWPEALQQPASDAFQICIAELPTAAESYAAGESTWRVNDLRQRIPLAFPSGRIVAALKKSSSQKAAWHLAVRLAGKEWGHLVTAESQAPGSVREQHIATPGGWPPATGFREAILATMQHSPSLTMLRIPAAIEYLEALNERVLRVLMQQQTTSAALEEVAGTWAGITEQRGKRDQILSYYQHLRLQP